MTRRQARLHHSIECILRFVVLMFLIFLPSIRCMNGEGGWMSCGALEGGRIVDLAINPQNPDILYAGTEDHGVFKSIDGGETWFPANNGISKIYTNIVALNPQNPEIIYAGTVDGVFKSVDGGLSWNAVNNGLSRIIIRALAIDPQDPEILYVALSNGENFRTTDGAVSWNAIGGSSVGLRIRAFAINPQNPEIIYAITDSGAGILKSTNHGETWEYVNNGLSVTLVTALAIDPQDSETLYATTDSGTYYPEYSLGIFKSTNGAETWSEITNGLQAYSPKSLVIDPKNPSILYVGTLLGAIYKSSDGGANWNVILIGSRISTLAIDRLSPANVYAGTIGGGIFKSVNGGLEWSASNTGLNALNIRTLAVDPQNELNVYAATNSGVFKSTDACKNWVAINSRSFSLTRNFFALAIDPQHPKTIYAGASESYSNTGFKSTDAGESWSEIGPFGPIYAFAIDPQNSEILYAGSSANSPFWKSFNGGTSWQHMGYDPWSGRLINGISATAFAVSSQDPDVLYVGTEGAGLYRSHDGGWSLFSMWGEPADVRALAINPQSPETVYVADWDAGVYKTTNGWDFSAVNNGITVTKATSLAIHPQRPSLIFAGTYGGGIFGSDNDGASWSPLNIGLADQYVQALAIGSAMPERMYASTYSGQVWVRPIPFPQLSTITIAANPPGLGIKIDGATYTTSQTFSWESGSSHAISVVTPQGSGWTRYVFTGWSDGGAISHTITVPAQATTYTAFFDTQYLLTTAVSPLGAGSISANPMAPDGYYSSGSTVRISAVPNSGYVFWGWSGDVAGTANPQNIAVSAPRSITANFRRVSIVPSRTPPRPSRTAPPRRDRKYSRD